MIASNDRSWWFGASDTDKIVGNFNTVTWQKWWATKLGLLPNNEWQTKYTRAGTYYEHAILRSLHLPLVYDYQIKIPELRLRVNYDGIHMAEKHIYECKTHKGDKPFKVSKTYWRQAQTEMFALETDMLDIVAYAMNEDNYKNFFLDIEEDRRTLVKVDRDDKFINGLLIPRLELLTDCLERGVFPK